MYKNVSLVSGKIKQAIYKYTLSILKMRGQKSYFLCDTQLSLKAHLSHHQKFQVSRVKIQDIKFKDLDSNLQNIGTHLKHLKYPLNIYTPPLKFAPFHLI